MEKKHDSFYSTDYKVAFLCSPFIFLLFCAVHNFLMQSEQSTIFCSVLGLVPEGKVSVFVFPEGDAVLGHFSQRTAALTHHPSIHSFFGLLWFSFISTLAKC